MVELNPVPFQLSEKQDRIFLRKILANFPRKW